MSGRTGGLLSFGASVLAGVAAIIASEDGVGDIVPFFVGLTVAGGIHAWSLTAQVRWRRIVTGVITAAWMVAAVWVGALLLMYQWACACSYPPRPAEATYLGLTATAYHLLGLYGGGALIVAATLWQSGQRRS